MKKILSIALVLCMVFAMAITANAATTGYMEFETSANEVTVGDTFTVTLKYVPGADSCFKGGTIKFLFDKTYATLNDEVASDLTSVFSNNLVNNKPANNLYTIKHLAGATDDWASVTDAGVYTTLEFTAVAAGDFTISCDTASVTFADAGNIDRLTYKGTSIAPITITIKDAAAADPTVYGDAAVCADTWTAVKNANTTNTNTYTNVAVATATYAAGATEAGFIFAKDVAPEKTGNKFVVLDATAIAGAGTVEYTAVMVGVNYDEVEAIYAMPYYVPAN